MFSHCMTKRYHPEPSFPELELHDFSATFLRSFPKGLSL